jgi:hypothetical protein
VVGEAYTCADGSTKTFASAAATIVQAAWTGPPGPYGWHGLSKDADLSIYITTTCTNSSAINTSSCTVADIPLLDDFFRYFIFKDPSYASANLTMSEFLAALHTAHRELSSSLGAEDPDLGAFARSGAKLVSWHGLADSVIPVAGTQRYYDSVLALDPGVRDYYRYFEAPGVGHCVGGDGYLPNGAFGALVEWVENGFPPETLRGDAQGGGEGERRLCPYPSRQVFVGKNASQKEGFKCVERL